MKKITFLLLFSFFTVIFSAAEIEKKYHLKAEFNKKNGITWYKHKNNTGGNTRVVLYFGQKKKDGALFVRIALSFYAPEKLFVNKYIFTLDDKEYILVPREAVTTVDVKTDRLRKDYFDSGDVSQGICERYDVMINQQEFDMLQAFAGAKTAKLRYEGVKGFKNVPIHNDSIVAVREVIAAIKELINKGKK